MQTIATPVQIGVIEKLREEELEEERSIQSVMLPAEPLRAGGVRISHEFQPVAQVGGDFLDYFEFTGRCIGLYLGDVSRSLASFGGRLPGTGDSGKTAGTVRSRGFLQHMQDKD